MSARKAPPLPFLTAVALVAAAIGDPLVESVANTGVFGRGYADHNHLSVIPAMTAGALLAILAISRHCVDLCRDSALRREWAIHAAKLFSGRSPLQDVPYVLVLQFAALFIMESTEQLVFSGRLAGGWTWLGGPALFSVVTHALIGTACALAITRTARTMVKRLATLVAIALDFILLSFGRRNAFTFARRRAQTACFRVKPLQVRCIGERAPPVLPALT